MCDGLDYSKLDKSVPHKLCSECGRKLRKVELGHLEWVNESMSDIFFFM